MAKKYNNFTFKFSYKKTMVSLNSKNVSDMRNIIFQAAEAGKTAYDLNYRRGDQNVA